MRRKLPDSRSEFEIRLENARFYAFHGVSDQERKVGNDFEVNVSLRVKYSDVIADDRIGATVSYADIYEIVRSAMEKPRLLLETVAVSIATAISERYRIISSDIICCPDEYLEKPIVTGGVISIKKLSPPIPGFTGSASVSLKF